MMYFSIRREELLCSALATASDFENKSTSGFGIHLVALVFGSLLGISTRNTINWRQRMVKNCISMKINGLKLTGKEYSENHGYCSWYW